MLRRFFCIFLSMICLVLPCGLAEAEDSELIRLHVVAQDDSDAAQALKLELRDVCLRCAEVCIGDAADANEAYLRLCTHLDDFQRACERRARELGFAGEIRAETGIFHFPNRIYGKTLVPEGEYRALRIVIGSGEGHNWWCVLYPNLCALDECHYAAGETPYYSQIVRWLKDKIGGKK